MSGHTVNVIRYLCSEPFQSEPYLSSTRPSEDTARHQSATMTPVVTIPLFLARVQGPLLSLCHSFSSFWTITISTTTTLQHGSHGRYCYQGGYHSCKGMLYGHGRRDDVSSCCCDILRLYLSGVALSRLFAYLCPFMP
jgi:hypothetical protein